jgi:hypothetical protein
VSTNAVPPLFVGLVDAVATFAPSDTAADPAFDAPLAQWLVEHRRHLDAWYSALIGVLLLPVDEIDHLRGAGLGDQPPTIGLAGEARRIGATLSAGGPMAHWVTSPPPVGGLRFIESAVAKRGEDPMPGLHGLLALASSLPQLQVYAEIPLAGGLLSALDAIAEARAEGVSIAPKFRTGGLAAELFPTPVELAAVICACRDRGMPFKLTAGLHRAVRHNDPETGLSHHGFVNILAAALVAADGAEVVTVAERLASTDPMSLVEVIRPHRSEPRPLWTGFGSSRVADAIRDLGALGLIAAAAQPPAQPPV